jgi:uncharacterized heparinase superfamily protein
MPSRAESAVAYVPRKPRHPGKLTLLFHTLRYLRPVQWRYRIKNTLQGQLHKRFPAYTRTALLRRVPAAIMLRPSVGRVAWFEKTHDGAYGFFRAAEIAEGRFTFLGCTRQFDGPVRWRNADVSYLWDFNLHYFEYLEPLAELGTEESAACTRALIAAWIAENPCPVQPGWHPYPLSLRTINWIKLFINHPGFADDAALRSLYAQFLFLERNLEGHLQVNHLLENGRALLFGGLYFDGPDADRWFKLGLHLLMQEVDEEYLPHGGHFERSPMYHCILLEALLDTHAYLVAAGHGTAWLAGPLRGMCAWLEDIRTPDGWFPLFNDAAIGVSAAPDEVLRNAARMLGYERKATLAEVRDCDQFYVLDAGAVVCAIDGAPIGPSYNAGHAHSDNFTFELFVDGAKVVADAGTSTYEVTPQRIAERSTAAHNTVLINGVEQSEAWGGFRVARRSNPDISHAGRSGECLVFRGRYRNQVESFQELSHERVIALHDSGWMLVWDRIEAGGAITAESLCRLVPECEVIGTTDGFAISRPGGGALRLWPIGCQRATLREDRYGPEFGKSLPATQVSMIAEGARRVAFGYFIARDGGTSKQPSAALEGNMLTLSLDGREFAIDVSALR